MGPGNGGNLHQVQVSRLQPRANLLSILSKGVESLCTDGMRVEGREVAEAPVLGEGSAHAA